ncbi:hypothetical protein EGW08_002298, partial [Elysia chlorotica]
SGSPRTRLVLFSTWIDKPEKQEAHENVLRTWRLWEPLVIPLIFTNNSNITARARSFGWKVRKGQGCFPSHHNNGMAMWLVSYAREMGVATIDVSATLRAVHMMATQAGNNESRDHPGSGCNHKIYNSLKIKPRSWFCGFLKCAQYRTVRDGNQVKVEDKSSTNHPRCVECEMDLAILKSTVY